MIYLDFLDFDPRNTIQSAAERMSPAISPTIVAVSPDLFASVLLVAISPDVVGNSVGLSFSLDVDGVRVLILLPSRVGELLCVVPSLVGKFVGALLDPPDRSLG